MAENVFQLKPACTVKFNSDELNYASEQILEMNPHYDEFTTFKTVFNDLLNRAVSKLKVSNVSQPEDLEKIQLLENEMGRQKILLDQASDKIYELREEIGVLSCRPVIGENQGVIIYPPIIARILDVEADAAEKKTGKKFNRADLLLGLYWEAVKIGRAYPYYNWDRSELAAIANELKQDPHVNE